MKKLINKSKLIFYIAVLFMFSINNAAATTVIIENGSHFVNFNEGIIRGFLPWILSVIGVLVFFVFIVGVITYLFCKKNKNKQKIVKSIKIISLSLKSLILVFLLYLSIIVFEDNLINILDKIN